MRTVVAPSNESMGSPNNVNFAVDVFVATEPRTKVIGMIKQRYSVNDM